MPVWLSFYMYPIFWKVWICESTTIVILSTARITYCVLITSNRYITNFQSHSFLSQKIISIQNETINLFEPTLCLFAFKHTKGVITDFCFCGLMIRVNLLSDLANIPWWKPLYQANAYDRTKPYTKWIFQNVNAHFVYLKNAWQTVIRLQLFIL